MKRWLTVLALALPLSAASFTAGAAGQVDRTFGHGSHRDSGFSDPIVPDPQISTPPTTSCQVTILTDYPFQNFTPATGSYAPPSGCPGPWNKIVLDVQTSVQGVQFDRVGALWIGNNEIYRFTTSEPPGPQISWDVQKDVTEYANVLANPSTYTYSLGNVVNQQYTGIYYVTATLTFYQTGSGYPAATVPDAVIPIAAAGSSPPWYTLNSGTDQASSAVTVPPNTQNAVLELYATGHICEEFWYANNSTAFESQLGSSCGGTAYREIDVTIDGQPAGVALPYPYLYTGADKPLDWLPLTGYDTLDIPPYTFDLTPFVGYLNDGNPHTIAAQVYNDTSGFWLVDGDLLITEDHGSAQTTGKLVSLTALSGSPETYWEHLNVNTGGAAEYRGKNFIQAQGYVNTSHGKITTTLSEHVDSNNNQYLTHPELASGTQLVTMGAFSNTVETVTNGSTATTTTNFTRWPFYIGLTNTLGVTQPYHQYVTVDKNGSTTWSSKDVVVSVATSSPEVTSVNFQLHDSSGDCYNRSLAATNGKLSSDTYACGGPSEKVNRRR
jgi:hypothetical protein